MSQKVEIEFVITAKTRAAAAALLDKVESLILEEVFKTNSMYSVDFVGLPPHIHIEIRDQY